MISRGDVSYADILEGSTVLLSPYRWEQPDSSALHVVIVNCKVQFASPEAWKLRDGYFYVILQMVNIDSLNKLV